MGYRLCNLASNSPMCTGFELSECSQECQKTMKGAWRSKIVVSVTCFQSWQSWAWLWDFCAECHCFILSRDWFCLFLTEFQAVCNAWSSLYSTLIREILAVSEENYFSKDMRKLHPLMQLSRWSILLSWDGQIQLKSLLRKSKWWYTTNTLW